MTPKNYVILLSAITLVTVCQKFRIANLKLVNEWIHADKMTKWQDRVVFTFRQLCHASYRCDVTENSRRCWKFDDNAPRRLYRPAAGDWLTLSAWQRVYGVIATSHMGKRRMWPNLVETFADHLRLTSKKRQYYALCSLRPDNDSQFDHMILWLRSLESRQN